MFSCRLSATFSAMPKVIFTSHLMIKSDSTFRIDYKRRDRGQ